MEILKGFVSRKFILTILVTGLVSLLPIVFKEKNVSDAVSMMVLGILGSVGAAYGFVNVKEAALEKPKMEIKPDGQA